MTSIRAAARRVLPFSCRARQASFLPSWQDVVVQAGSVLITSRLREFHLQVIDVILAPQLCELTEEDGSDFDSLACNHCSFAAGRRGVQFSEEYVPLGVGLFLGGSVLASAGT